MTDFERDNRLLTRIAKARDCLTRGVRIDTGEPLPADFDAAGLERSMDNTLAEFAAFQGLQSRAHLMGVLTTAEAQTIYVALGGEAPAANGWASDTDLATKLIVTQVLHELMRTVGGVR